MRLLIKDNEIEMQMKIKNWSPLVYDEDDELVGYPWCVVDMPVKTHYLDYNVGGEIFERGEVIDFRDELGRFMSGEITKERRYGFIEPDLNFYFLPGDRPQMIMEINFWIGHRFLGAGKFLYPLNKEEVTNLYRYLQLVTGELKESDLIIKEMVEKGILIL